MIFFYIFDNFDIFDGCNTLMQYLLLVTNDYLLPVICTIR